MGVRGGRSVQGHRFARILGGALFGVILLVPENIGKDLGVGIVEIAVSGGQRSP